MASPYPLSSSRAVPAPVDETFRHTLALPLTEMFSRRYLALPPVVHVDQLDPGPWGTVGQRRTDRTADGGTVLETLTRVEEPDLFAYEITDIRGPLSPLTHRIEGRYTFEKAGTGTRVTWSWMVHPRTAVAAAALPVFARMWSGWARQALEQLERSLV